MQSNLPEIKPVVVADLVTHYTFDEIVQLLRDLISTPSQSGAEQEAASKLDNDLHRHGIATHRLHNNIWALSKGFDSAKPTLMLNSHIDTVRPNEGYTRDPYDAAIEDGRLYGLGSNDAGASLVALVATFVDLYDTTHYPFNLLLAISAEEEKMGERGIRALLPALKAEGVEPKWAIVGEPTLMQSAVGERGLVVLDGTAHGRSGHAAREEGINSLYLAIDDINALRNFRFERVSEVLGDIKVTVTQIEAGQQHNIIPYLCRFVVDIRTTDAYSNEEVVEILQGAVKHSTLVPRSTRIHASALADTHPLVEAATRCGCKPYVSPTTSDRALMHGIEALKIGVGDSARSHMADEWVGVDEIERGWQTYKQIIINFAKKLNEIQ